MPVLRSQPAWWQWLTVLSLDAPIVCMVWQMLLARIAGITLSWPPAFVLGASVWLAYAADRWLEGWRIDGRRVRTQRHRFYQRRRWLVLAVWLGVFVMDVGVALAAIDRTDFIRGLLLLGAVVTYLLSHQLVHRHSSWRAPKEVIVACLLTAGVAVFVVPSHGLTLLIPAASFGLACFTNCGLISSWEQDVDLAQGQTSLALTSERHAHLIKWLPWTVTGLNVVAFLLMSGPARVAPACAAGGTFLLAIVDQAEPFVGWTGARVLADIALMTPLVSLLWGP
jgi:hypothetical protein